MLVGGGDHGILVPGKLPGRETVSDVARADVVFGPVRRPCVSATGAWVFVPEDVAGRPRSHQVWRGVVANFQHRDIVTDIGDVVNDLPMIPIVLKGHEFRGSQADGARAHDVLLAIAVEIFQPDIVASVFDVDDVRGPGLRHRRGRLTVIERVVEPYDHVADGGNDTRISVAGKLDGACAFVGAALADNRRPLPGPLQLAALRLIQIETAAPVAHDDTRKSGRRKIIDGLLQRLTHRQMTVDHHVLGDRLRPGRTHCARARED